MTLIDWDSEPADLPVLEPLAEWQRDVTHISPGYTANGQAGIRAGEAYSETIGECSYAAIRVQLWLGDGSYDLIYLTDLGFAYYSFGSLDYVVGIAAVE